MCKSNNNSSTIKIALFTGYGYSGIPEWLLKQLPTPIYGVESRIKLAELLDNLEPTCAKGDTIQEAWNKFSKSKSIENTPYFRVEGQSTVYLKICENTILPLEVEVTIKEVDISKPWRIVSYDGCESIEIFNGIEVKDEKYNVCEW